MMRRGRATRHENEGQLRYTGDATALGEVDTPLVRKARRRV